MTATPPASESSAPPLVAIVAHDHGATIAECIRAVVAEPGLPLDLVVWDDGSSDRTAAIARDLAPTLGFRFVSEPRLGLPQVLSRLAALAGERDLVLVHGDAIVATPRWLQRLATTAAAHADTGVVGAMTLFPDGRIQSAGRLLVHALGSRDHHANLGWLDRPAPDTTEVRPVDSVYATLALFRRSALTATGGFDPRFGPAWLVDDDFCTAVRAKGFEVVCDHGVAVVHRQARPDARKPALPMLHGQWRAKWGWHPEFPNLGAIRARWGETRLCWRIGSRLLGPALPPAAPVEVVMVTWNSLARLRRCLASLAATDYPDLTVHLLDNGSTDGTREFLHDLPATGYRWPLRIETLPCNIGLPPALNLLVARTTAPLVARLDDDVELPAHWLTRLTEDLRAHPYAGCVGPKVVNLGRPGLQNAGEPWCHPLPAVDDGRFDYLAYANHVRGCCNLYRRHAFTVAGLFDVRFNPSQFDDPDHHLALRAAGFDILYDGRIAVAHHLGAGADTTRKGAANQRGNLIKLQGKWGDDAFAVLDRGIELAGRIIEDLRPTPLRGTSPFPAQR